MEISLIQKIEGQLKMALPMVAYRKPRQNALRILFQSNRGERADIGTAESGFVFAPFSSDSSKIVLRPDESVEVEYPVKSTESLYSVDRRLPDVDKLRYCNLVRKAIDEIRNTEVEKIVLSRRIEFHTEKPVLEVFQNLLNAYPDAYCYLWYHPETGIWMGASPELLLKIEGMSVQTTSLAGTLPIMKDRDPAWTKKEQDEQAMVTRFITKVFEEHGGEVQAEGPVSQKAGSVWHLSTRIQASFREAVPEVLIEELHPTPAVCGLPRENALQFILEEEGYDRTYYTGYFGELNMSNSDISEFYVNLRCMKYRNGSVDVYVGGGITAESDPEKEWEETVYKSQTLLRTL